MKDILPHLNSSSRNHSTADFSAMPASVEYQKWNWHTAFRNGYLYTTSTRVTQMFSMCAHAVRLRAGLQGQRVEQQIDTWHKPRAWDGKSCSRGLAPSPRGWLLGRLTAPHHAPKQPPPCHNLTENCGGRSSQVPPGLLASQGKDEAPIQAWGPQSWHSPYVTTRRDLMAICSHDRRYSTIPGATTLHFDPHQVKTNASQTHLPTCWLPQLLHYWNNHWTCRLSSLSWLAVRWRSQFV